MRCFCRPVPSENGTAPQSNFLPVSASSVPSEYGCENAQKSSFLPVSLAEPIFAVGTAALVVYEPSHELRLKLGARR